MDSEYVNRLFTSISIFLWLSIFFINIQLFFLIRKVEKECGE